MPTQTIPDLSMAYADTGPRDGPVVLLIHGWPDDASTWEAVAARLNAAGLRTIVPTLRGFGRTRFVSDDAPRTGNSAMLAMDLIALLDALEVDRFMVAGHDWGSNTAEALAVGWPDRVERLAMLSTPPRLGGMPTPPFRQAQRQWYHWFMATARGAQAVRDDPHGFAHIHWENWSPPGWFDEPLFRRVARSFDNPAWVDVTLHSYRARWGEAAPDPRSRWLEDKVAATSTLPLPTLYIQGAEDGINPPSTSAEVSAKFTGPFDRVELPGIGHFPQREAPREVAQHLIGLFGDTVVAAKMRNGKPGRNRRAGLAAALAVAAAGAFAAKRAANRRTRDLPPAPIGEQATSAAAADTGGAIVPPPRDRIDIDRHSA